MHDRCSPGRSLKLVFVPFFLPMLSQHDARGGKRQISPTTFSTHYLQKNMVLPWQTTLLLLDVHYAKIIIIET
jgi:hypothetical protein